MTSHAFTIFYALQGPSWRFVLDNEVHPALPITQTA